jgi:hypothetical protein
LVVVDQDSDVSETVVHVSDVSLIALHDSLTSEVFSHFKIAFDEKLEILEKSPATLTSLFIEDINSLNEFISTFVLLTKLAIDEKEDTESIATSTSFRIPAELVKLLESCISADAFNIAIAEDANEESEVISTEIDVTDPPRSENPDCANATNPNI